MRRYRIALIVLLVLLLAITFRLFHLQVLQHDLWAAQAQKIQQQEIVKLSQRGRIYDRNGVLLAEDIPAVSIALDNSQMTRPEKLQQLLKRYLGFSDAEAHGKIYKSAYFTWLKRHVDTAIAEQLKTEARANQVQGLIFLDDFRRSYPQRDLASNVVGFTNTDNNGIEGAELQFNETLKGTESLVAISAMGDRNRTEIKREVLKPGTPGKNIYLTVDSRIQQYAESAISEGARRYQAKSGFILVMNVQTGEIEAMAQSKRYNLNLFKQSSPEQRKNLAVTFPFEPGSSAKIFTMLAALEADPGIVHQSFDGGVSYRPAVIRKRGNEAITTYPRAFRNSEFKGYGMVTPNKIIQESINTAMIQIAYEIIGPQRLYEHLLDLGFAQKTGIDLPGEIAGFLKEPNPILHPTVLGDLAIGQAFSVTGIQLVTALAAIANGGILLQPKILLSTEEKEGLFEKNAKRDKPKLIAHRASTESLTEMMKDVVRQGTGIAAQIEGYDIAAKSGTAQKAIPGEGYVKGKYTSLFVGFLPADRPQYAIVVVFDEVGSKEYYGGRTAGPVFKDIAKGIIRLKEIPPFTNQGLENR
jgi:cell division protein FtsI/penicillin-binding protein 2